MIKTKVLVTGSNGLLGQKLTELYIKNPNYELIATGKGPNRNKITSGYIYEDLDVSDNQAVHDIFQKHLPAIVIHGAAMTNVDACELNHELCYQLNVMATSNIAFSAEKINAHLIHISTDFIFDGKHAMYREEEEPNPLSYYGLSKWEAEKIVTKIHSLWTIIRTVLVYGVVNDMSRSNIVLWAKNALSSGNPINVVDDQFRTPTLAEDLAMGAFLAGEKKAGGIFHIAGPDYMSILQLVQKVAAYFHLPVDQINGIKSDQLNQPAKRPPITGLDITKAKQQLGYNPRSFEEGLEIISQQLQAYNSPF